MKALFGGTFNPVHQGHIALALGVAGEFGLSWIEFVPSHQPVHRRQPRTSPTQRLAMLQLALADHPRLAVNPIEIERSGPSFTVDTLESLRQQDSAEPLCWLMGADAFNGFERWKQPRRILELAHLIVCARPGTRLERGAFADCFLAPDEKLADYPAGRIAHFSMPPNGCSSTGIRQALRRGDVPDGCLAPAVLDFIKQHHLYEN